MGLIYRRIPQSLALSLKDKYRLKVFVETGTFMGKTCEWAANYFPLVLTVELFEDYYKATSQRLKNISNIRFFHGDSGTILGKVLKLATSPALIWLDAHWSRDLAYTVPDGLCPVLRELDWIILDKRSHVILVDDAGLFVGKNGFPKKELIVSSMMRSARKVCEVTDVLVSEPR
ncbi:MAG TPA: hypothetical protein VFF49_06995 [Thermodesulfobacteriota bacterium]|nr:hypothetical protein [Thermodesulfobacteriota bacterium]